MPELRNYKLDIEIDEDDYEGEWITHSSIYLYYAEMYAEAIELRDNTKLKMEWIEAKIDLDVRQNWESKKYKLTSKPTESAIKNIIKTSKSYLKITRKYNKTVKRVNSLIGVKTAFEHKKHALGNLVSMKISGFHAEPRNKIRDLKKQISVTTHEKHKNELNDRIKKRRSKK